MHFHFSVDEIIAIVQPTDSRGSTSESIRGIAGLAEAGPGDLSFLGNPRYKAEVASTRASVVLLPADFSGEPQPNQRFLLLPRPSVGLARLCSRLEALLWPAPPPGIHPTAVVAPDAQVAASAAIGPHCVVEAGAVIGERAYLQARVFVGRRARLGADCRLLAGVTVATECILGDRVRLHPGVVVGSDGFGYEFTGGRHEKVPQVGHVLLENDVEIGANTTLDRARFSRTVVGEGTKIDNLVQIAHNVIIGRHCLICAQAGISGSTKIEDFVVIGGQAGLVGHITVGRGAKIDAQSGVNGNLAAGNFVKGTPCLPYQTEQRINVLRKRLPDLFKRVGALEEALGTSST